MVLAILKAEVRFADPEATLPTDEAIATVGRMYALNSPQARALLAPILAAADNAHVPIPLALRAPEATSVPR
jgi:hypothetical protein